MPPAARGSTRKQKAFNLFDIPTYLINMDERKDRLERLMTDKKEIFDSMKQLRRISGVNGKKINYMNDKRISIRTRFNIYRNYRRSHHEIATLGAVGATLSHVKVWKTFLKTRAPYCLVLEDDVDITMEQILKVHEAWKTIPSDWGVWILGYYYPHLVREPLAAKKDWYQVHTFTGAHAYIITREVAKKLLEEVFPIEMHIEHYTSVCSLLKKFKIVMNQDIYVNVYGRGKKPGSTSDSNTSQHKKRSCATCKVPDDYSMLYKKYGKMTRKGQIVHGIIHGEQTRKVITLKNAPVKKD